MPSTFQYQRHRLPALIIVHRQIHKAAVFFLCDLELFPHTFDDIRLRIGLFFRRFPLPVFLGFKGDKGVLLCLDLGLGSE